LINQPLSALSSPPIPFLKDVNQADIVYLALIDIYRREREHEIDVYQFLMATPFIANPFNQSKWKCSSIRSFLSKIFETKSNHRPMWYNRYRPRCPRKSLN
jgi:hypothetical protein